MAGILSLKPAVWVTGDGEHAQMRIPGGGAVQSHLDGLDAKAQ